MVQIILGGIIVVVSVKNIYNFYKAHSKPKHKKYLSWFKHIICFKIILFKYFIANLLALWQFSNKYVYHSIGQIDKNLTHNNFTNKFTAFTYVHVL